MSYNIPMENGFDQTKIQLQARVKPEYVLIGALLLIGAIAVPAMANVYLVQSFVLLLAMVAVPFSTTMSAVSTSLSSQLLFYQLDFVLRVDAPAALSAAVSSAVMALASLAWGLPQRLGVSQAALSSVLHSAGYSTIL